MFLSIIIPTYNEAENISKLLEQICQHVSEIECEILIVDDNCDIVIASRYMKGGKIIGWPLTRRIISKGATILAQSLLKLEFSEIMGGFYIFRKKITNNVEFTTNGQKFFMELLVKSDYKKVKDIPMTFKNRTEGKSKFNFADAKNFISALTELRKFKKIK